MHKIELIEKEYFNRNYCMLAKKIVVFYRDGDRLKKRLSKIVCTEKSRYHDFFLWCVLRFPLFYWVKCYKNKRHSLVRCGRCPLSPASSARWFSLVAVLFPCRWSMVGCVIGGGSIPLQGSMVWVCRFIGRVLWVFGFFLRCVLSFPLFYWDFCSLIPFGIVQRKRP